MRSKNRTLEVLFAIEWIATLAILILLMMSEGGAYRTILIVCTAILLVLVTGTIIYLYRNGVASNDAHLRLVPGSSDAVNGSKGH